MFPSKLTDQKYLRDQQYHSAANLNTRIQIHERFSTNPNDWFLWMFDQIELPPTARLLELGCGPGDLWARNASRLPRGWQITLADLSAGMARQARQALSDAGCPFFYAAADAQTLPFPEACFDAVIANHMLYHVPDRKKAFAEIWRALKPEGRLYAATNGRDHLRELWELVVDIDPGFDQRVRDLPFSLENGAVQLAPWFSGVTTRRYENDLQVTEAAPLVEYVLSMTANASGALSRQASALYVSFQERIDRDGSIFIQKVVGLFIAQKDQPPTVV